MTLRHLRFISAVLLLNFAACDSLKSTIVKILGSADKYKAEGDPTNFVPKFTGNDASREKIAIQLREVASGFKQITDIQFPSGETAMALIAEKTGGLHWLNLKTRQSGVLHQFEVISAAEGPARRRLPSAVCDERKNLFQLHGERKWE